MGALDDLKNRQSSSDRRKEERQAKLVKNGGKGTNVGNALRWLSKSGTTIAPAILDIAGSLTGIDKLHELADAIEGDKGLSRANKDLLLAEIQADVEQERERTKRWEADMKSEHWLPKLIRPLVLANYTILIDIVILNSMWGKPLIESYIPLVMTMGVTVTGGYFALREYGKTKK
tara:strand:+ start:5043 stop:5567 length:525 start_codon:yes stop_codon:yes gene_type:complete